MKIRQGKGAKLYTHIIPAKDWKILRKYLHDSHAVLIHEDIAKQQGITINKLDNMKYDFGGAEYTVYGGGFDIRVDIVGSPAHYFVKKYKEFREKLNENKTNS